jgi:hypothetical protein
MKERVALVHIEARHIGNNASGWLVRIQYEGKLMQDLSLGSHLRYRMFRRVIQGSVNHLRYLLSKQVSCDIRAATTVPSTLCTYLSTYSDKHITTHCSSIPHIFFAFLRLIQQRRVTANMVYPLVPTTASHKAYLS